MNNPSNFLQRQTNSRALGYNIASHAFHCGFDLFYFHFVSAQAVKLVGCVLALHFWKSIVRSLLKIELQLKINLVPLYFGLTHRTTMYFQVGFQSGSVCVRRSAACVGARSCEEAHFCLAVFLPLSAQLHYSLNSWGLN